MYRGKQLSVTKSTSLLQVGFPCDMLLTHVQYLNDQAICQASATLENSLHTCICLTGLKARQDEQNGNTCTALNSQLFRAWQSTPTKISKLETMSKTFGQISNHYSDFQLNS